MKEQTTEREEPKYKPPTMSGTAEERCLAALEHVCHGLECLQYFPTEDSCEEEQKKMEEEENERKRKEYEETHPNMAKPFQAIPMPYTSLKEENKEAESRASSVSNSPTHKRKSKQRKNKKPERVVLREQHVHTESSEPKALLCKHKAETLPTWQAPQKTDNISWNAHLKTLLYEKASLIFAVLAENEYANRNYGASLRYMLAVLRCQKILEIFCGIRNDKSISYLLGRAGDCCFMAVQDWCNVEKHRKDYEMKNATEEKIVEEICRMEDLDMSMYNIWMSRRKVRGR